MESRDFMKGSIGASAAFVTASEANKASAGEQADQFYAVLELMGYKRLVGRVTTGSPLWRIDVPVEGGFVTKFFNPTSVYCITVTDEKSVREMAKGVDPIPTLELEVPLSQTRLGFNDYDDDDEAGGF